MNNLLSRVYAVVVLYNCKVSESETLITLNQALDAFDEKLPVLVYDNTKELEINENNFSFSKLVVEYYHNPSNPGISSAYNLAITKGNQNNKSWLLLLDQDSSLNQDYFEELILSIDNNSSNEDVVCYIPKVFLKTGVQISPSKLRLGGFSRTVTQVGLHKDSITAINSGTLINIDFIEAIGGFSSQFPLDMLDHWYFREIFNHKKMIYVLNTKNVHELSVKTFENSVSINRYKIILEAEKEFYRSNFLNYFIYKYRLCCRLFKQLFYSDKTYLKMSFKSLIGNFL